MSLDRSESLSKTGEKVEKKLRVKHWLHGARRKRRRRRREKKGKQGWKCVRCTQSFLPQAGVSLGVLGLWSEEKVRLVLLKDTWMASERPHSAPRPILANSKKVVSAHPRAECHTHTPPTPPVQTSHINQSRSQVNRRRDRLFSFRSNCVGVCFAWDWARSLYRAGVLSLPRPPSRLRAFSLAGARSRGELDALIRPRCVFSKPRCMCAPHVPGRALPY